jgi:two-component system sensor histidine kinase/response regulator
MVNGLLDVGRIESSRMPIQRQASELHALVDQAVGNVSAGDPLRPITVDVPRAISLSCDPDVTRRVIENLVSNGLKHTPEHSPLGIRAIETLAAVRVEVTDQGEGIAAEDRERIFQKFGAMQARSRYHSSGLGLAFCRLAVEAHGGRIGVEDAPGGGSTFWFELPSSADDTAAVTASR